jgi:hypothetical protein
MPRTRRHLTFANVVSVVALSVALGGTAIASAIITSNGQVDRGTISGHNPPSGKHPNVIGGSINGQDVQHLEFQRLTLKSGWGSCPGAGAPGIAKSVEGVVHFRGSICRASGSSNPFAVPAGFRPTKDEWIAVDENNGASGELLIDPSTGEVYVYDDPDHPGSGTTFTSLAGVSYTLPY